ncbi:MAG: biotin--[acetyl-CoA-carboxylase] ligase, partial [Anaerolineales bacterium]
NDSPDISLVGADEQTAGRGRAGRKWYTPSGAALAFTIVFPSPTGTGAIPLLAGLGGLAVCEAFTEGYGLPARIKWPNDVLINRRKVCGVLPEARWLGDHRQTLILGIGVNVAPPSVPSPEWLDFPATCVEAELGEKIERLPLLRHVLAALLDWFPRLESPAFIHAWENRLAFCNERVCVLPGVGDPVEGKVIGLTRDGQLKLRTLPGKVRIFQTGEVRLRPVDKTPKLTKLVPE